MGRLGSGSLLVAVISVGIISGCGTKRPPGLPSAPAKITLTPAGSTSLQVGTIISFSASATDASNRAIPTTFTFASSDTSVLTIAPNGVACAGLWNSAYNVCSPGGTGVVQVTASALGSTSAPAFVFVHPVIDNITVTGVLLNGVPIQEPCLSQGQTMTVEAHAFSQGSDITASVGPFTWTANNANVVKITPLVNSAYNFATNQATLAAATPGLTQIYASASNVSSTSFQQPQLLDQNKNPIPVIFDFFETCPIQNITLELGHAGSEQTTFATSKGTSETVIATVTDVMGNSSLPNTDGGLVLSKIPLTWSASQPAVIGVGTGCMQSCTLSTPSAGAAAVAASCSPPTCNIGFPGVPVAFATPAALAKCAQYFPPSCQQYIPLPVYAAPLPLPAHTTGAVSGVVSGTTSSATVLATGLGCAGEPPANCTTAIYGVSTSRATAGSENPMPVSPNSLLFDPAGDKVYVGSDFGAQTLNPANLGTTTSAFAALGTVTGKVLAISANGSAAVFSDTLHVPNQVYVVNGSATTALNIYGASVAAFSGDGLKAFIFGFDSNSSPNLYVYSTLQSLQTTCAPLPGPCAPWPANTTISSIAFSANGAFAYVVEPMLGGVGPAVSVYNVCNNGLYTDTISGKNYIPLSSPPIAFKALPDGVHFVALESGGNIDYISAVTTRIPPATLTSPATSLCPMTVGHDVQTFNLEQGNITPINFFLSPDGTLLYVLASDRSSVLMYSITTLKTGGVELTPAGGIPLAGNAVPAKADISVDGGTILVAGSDGMLHEVSTALGGNDQLQVPFPNLPNFFNPFCTMTPASGPCTLDFIATKP